MRFAPVAAAATAARWLTVVNRIKATTQIYKSHRRNKVSERKHTHTVEKVNMCTERNSRISYDDRFGFGSQEVGSAKLSSMFRV